MSTSIVWFRRDLRLHDHPALLAAASGDRVAPLFVLDETLLAGDVAPNRVWFMLATLDELAADLERLGSRLFVRRGRPEAVVPAFAAAVRAVDVHVPDAWVHEPWTMPPDVQAAAGCRVGVEYPSPIVDHRAARARALAALSAAGAPGRRDPLGRDRQDAPGGRGPGEATGSGRRSR